MERNPKDTCGGIWKRQRSEDMDCLQQHLLGCTAPGELSMGYLATIFKD